MNFVAIAAMAVVLAVFAQSADCQYYLGPKGGCYTLSKSGKKRYVDRSMCAIESAPAASSPLKPSAATGADSGTSVALSEYRLGSRGGCYTLSASGSKRYVDRSRCESARKAAPATGTVSAFDAPAAAARSSSRYHLGSRGGCYTISASGSKRYVDREMCR